MLRFLSIELFSANLERWGVLLTVLETQKELK